MEGLMKRVFVLCAVFAAFGLLIFGTSRKDFKKKTEDELISMAPLTVGNMAFTPSPTDHRITYRMDEVTYKTLNPFGIVARRYNDGDKHFDAVLIASRSRASFHDPRICFTAQGWTIEKQSNEVVQSKKRGKVPITLVEMRHQDGRRNMAAYFYKGPGGKFYGTTQGLKWGMFFEQLRGGDDIDGIFYRFIPDYERATIDEFKDFIGKYLDYAEESSKGYF